MPTQFMIVVFTEFAFDAKCSFLLCEKSGIVDIVGSDVAVLDGGCIIECLCMGICVNVSWHTGAVLKANVKGNRRRRRPVDRLVGLPL